MILEYILHRRSEDHVFQVPIDITCQELGQTLNRKDRIKDAPWHRDVNWSETYSFDIQFCKTTVRALAN